MCFGGDDFVAVVISETGLFTPPEKISNDMLVTCSAATFGIINIANAIRSGTAKTVLVINPEILSPQINYRDKYNHLFLVMQQRLLLLKRNQPHPVNMFSKLLPRNLLLNYLITFVVI